MTAVMFCLTVHARLEYTNLLTSLSHLLYVKTEIIAFYIPYASFQSEFGQTSKSHYLP